MGSIGPPQRQFPSLAELDLLARVLEHVVGAVGDHPEPRRLGEEIHHRLDASGGPVFVPPGDRRKHDPSQNSGEDGPPNASHGPCPPIHRPARCSEPIASRRTEALRSSDVRSASSSGGAIVASGPLPETRWGNAKVIPANSGTPCLRPGEHLGVAVLAEHVRVNVLRVTSK